LGVIESFQIDPKFASAEAIMAPMPGRLVKTKVIVPYQEPMIAFTLKEIPKEAIEMALGTQALTDTSTTFNPTAGTPGMEGYLRAQKYDQENNLISELSSLGLPANEVSSQRRPEGDDET
jgi:hypothetical protein